MIEFLIGFVIGGLVGVTVCFLFVEIASASAMNMGLAFYKKKGRWYPYNPFRGGEPGRNSPQRNPPPSKGR